MNKVKKVKFFRGKEYRDFKQDAIDRHSTKEKPWPESEGWKRVPDEVTDVVTKEKEIPAGEKPKAAAKDEKPSAANASNADNAGSENNTSSDAKSETGEDAGTGAQEDKNEGEASGDNGAEEPKVLKSSAECKCTPEDIERIELALAGKSVEEVTAFFDNDTRATMRNLRDAIIEKIPA